MKISKTKTIVLIVVSFAVSATTLFALAENKNNNPLFLDSDQDGLTDQEEKAIGTDPQKADTDGDGYSDGKEVASGYNPLKPAPGDTLISVPRQNSESETTASNSQPEEQQDYDYFLNQTASDSYLSQDILNNLDSDPQNPNLTNEMIGEFLKLTKTKSDESENFLDNPSLSSQDFEEITANALQKADISSELPEIRPDEIKVLPPIDDKDLSENEIKEKQKEEIQKYLASLAFVFATNSPFPVDEPENFVTSSQKEQENLLSAMTTGNQKQIDDYARRARAGIEQIKKVEVPYILQDIHKSALQLAIYTLGLKDKVVIDPNDPMKNLAALSSLQTVAESTLKLQSEMKAIADEYGIDIIELP